MKHEPVILITMATVTLIVILNLANVISWPHIYTEMIIWVSAPTAILIMSFRNNNNNKGK